MDEIFNILFTQQVPASTLWRPWDAMQVTYLVLGTLAIIWILRWMTHVAPEKKKTVVAVTASVVFSMWIIPPVLQCITDTGERWIDHLPLHLCSSACIIIPLGLLTRYKPLMNYAYGLCLPGALAAVIFPGELYRRLSTYSFHFFLFNFSHMCIIVACLAPIALGFFRPQWRYYLAAGGLGIALMAIAYPVNKILGSNYFFVNWPEQGTILELFGTIAGRNMYIPVLIVVAGIVIALMFGIWTAVAKVRKPSVAIALAD